MSNLLSFTTPNSKKELFARLRTIIDTGWQNLPDSPRYKGAGAPGNYLEDLLGIKAGNQDIADILGWEVKFVSPQTNLITLFSKEPQPLGIVRYMVSRFGWKDEDGRLSFRHTIRGKSAILKVFEDAGNIIIRPIKGNGSVPMWNRDTLLNIAGGKLRRLMLVRGEFNKKTNQVRYVRVDCFENLHLSLFISELINGTIAIDFCAREQSAGSKGLRNHGTKFRISPDDVCRIYQKKERLT